MSDGEGVHFHRWACRLALHDGYRAAHRIHELWSEQYEDGVESAVKWAEACRVGMMAEAARDGQGPL